MYGIYVCMLKLSLLRCSSAGKKVIASTDIRFTVASTIRTSSCSVLGLLKDLENGSRCSSCHGHRKVLNSLLSRFKKCENEPSDGSEPSSHVNYRYLNTPQKHERMQKLHQAVRVKCQRVERLKKKIALLIEDRGVEVDEELNEDLTSIMKDNSDAIMERYPADSFARIFWEQQLKASTLKDMRSMKWEPMMIRWCLYLRHLSSSAYETLEQ